jgi:hypothetical protein
MDCPELLQRFVRPLASRKVRVALATVLAAYGAECGFDVSEEMMLAIVSVGVALILGIAHEDHGAKGSARANRPESEGT